MMHAYTKPEAEAPSQPILTEPTIEAADPHGAVAFKNLCELVREQQRQIDLVNRAMLEVAKQQGMMRDTLIDLTTRCSELAGVLTSKAFAATGGAL